MRKENLDKIQRVGSRSRNSEAPQKVKKDDSRMFLPDVPQAISFSKPKAEMFSTENIQNEHMSQRIWFLRAPQFIFF